MVRRNSSGTDGDPHSSLRHGQGGDGVFRLQDQLGLEEVAAEVLIHRAAGAVAPLDEDKGHVLEGVDVRPEGELLPDLAGPVPEDLVGEGLGHPPSSGPPP